MAAAATSSHGWARGRYPVGVTTSIVYQVLAQMPLAAGGTGRTGLTAPETLLLFVGAPVGMFLLIAAVVMRPGTRGGTRYRPGRGWDAPETWFGDQPAGSETGSTNGSPSGHGAPGGSSGGW